MIYLSIYDNVNYLPYTAINWPCNIFILGQSSTKKPPFQQEDSFSLGTILFTLKLLLHLEAPLSLRHLFIATKLTSHKEAATIQCIFDFTSSCFFYSYFQMAWGFQWDQSWKSIFVLPKFLRPAVLHFHTKHKLHFYLFTKPLRRFPDWGHSFMVRPTTIAKFDEFRVIGPVSKYLKIFCPTLPHQT